MYPPHRRDRSALLLVLIVVLLVLLIVLFVLALIILLVVLLVLVAILVLHNEYSFFVVLELHTHFAQFIRFYAFPPHWIATPNGQAMHTKRMQMQR